MQALAAVVIGALSMVACGGPVVPGVPGDQGTPSAATAPPEQSPTGGPPPDLAPGTITAVVGGRNLTFPNVAFCTVSETFIEISAGGAGGISGLTVVWNAGAPEQAVINLADLSVPLTLSLGAHIPDAPPPQVSVSAGRADIDAEMYDAVQPGPAQHVRISADCPSSSPPPGGAEPTADVPPSAGGQAVVVGAGGVHAFADASTCVIAEGQLHVQMTNESGDTLDILPHGEGGSFMLLVIGGEHWSAGLNGSPMEFTVAGNAAIWAGGLARLSGEPGEFATVEVECVP